MGAIVLMKALVVGFLIGFSVVGLSKTAIAALPVPTSTPAITVSANAANASIDQRMSGLTRAMWSIFDSAFGRHGASRLQ